MNKNIYMLSPSSSSFISLFSTLFNVWKTLRFYIVALYTFIYAYQFNLVKYIILVYTIFKIVFVSYTNLSVFVFFVFIGYILVLLLTVIYWYIFNFNNKNKYTIAFMYAVIWLNMFLYITLSCDLVMLTVFFDNDPNNQMDYEWHNNQHNQGGGNNPNGGGNPVLHNPNSDSDSDSERSHIDGQSDPENLDIDKETHSYKGSYKPTPTQNSSKFSSWWDECDAHRNREKGDPEPLDSGGPEVWKRWQEQHDNPSNSSDESETLDQYGKVVDFEPKWNERSDPYEDTNPEDQRDYYRCYKDHYYKHKAQQEIHDTKDTLDVVDEIDERRRLKDNLENMRDTVRAINARKNTYGAWQDDGCTNRLSTDSTSSSSSTNDN